MSDTRKRFWVYQSVATMPDGTGKFRAEILKFSPLYDYSESDLVEYVKARDLPARLIGPMYRYAYDALVTRGYTNSSDPGETIQHSEWIGA